MTRAYDDRWYLSVHEAAHAVVAVALGRRVRFASIRSTDRYLGIVTWTPGERGKIPEAGAPAILWPAGPRRHLEVDICVCLAGRIAEQDLRLLPPSRKRYRIPPDARAAAVRLADMSQREAAMLRETEQSTHKFTPDDEAARQDALILSGVDLASAHLRYLEALTKALVHKHRAEIRAVAEALYEREVLSGRAVKQLVQTAKGVADAGHQKN